MVIYISKLCNALFVRVLCVFICVVIYQYGAKSSDQGTTILLVRMLSEGFDIYLVVAAHMMEEAQASRHMGFS